MKRAIALMIIFIVILELFGSAAIATEPQPTITIGNEQATRGATVQLSVMLENNPGFAGMDLYITFDTTRLILKSAVVSLGSPTESNIDDSVTEYSAHWATGTVNVTGNGTLLALTFQVKAEASLGDAFVNARIGEGSTFYVDTENKVEIDFSLNVVNGKISVGEETSSSLTPITDFDITKEENEITINEYIGSATEVIIGEKYVIEEVEYTVTKITGYTTGSGRNKAYIGAFSGNTSVEKIIIPSTVTQIGDIDAGFYSFSGCTSLTDITVLGNPTIGAGTLGMIYDESKEQDVKITGVTIHGWSGDATHTSSVQTYANANGITFTGLEDVKFRCYQTTDMNGSIFKMRFVGTLDSLNYQSVGFEISETTNAKSWTSSSTAVYKELYGRTADNTIIASKKATDYENSACLFAATINGIPTDTALEFTIRAYVINNIGAKVYDNTCNIHITAEGEITDDWN